MKKTNVLHQLILAAILMALTTVMTLVIRIPIPNAQGYLNLGDAILMLASIILGPAYGFIVGAMGSASADFIGGYGIYVPITFVVKGLEALIAGYLFKKWGRSLPAVVIAAIWMACGYFIAESFLYGWATALIALPMNLLQGGFGAIIVLLVLRALPAKVFSLSGLDH